MVSVISIPSNISSTTLTYRDAGVNIDSGNKLVQNIKWLAGTTARAGAVINLGGFSAIFDPLAAGYRDPILVATTDGVGTKLKVAIAAGNPDTVGIDLVAMSVNDLVVLGAEPLFFLDYFATGCLNIAMAGRVIAGIAKGCKEAGCALIGGETAEMPDMYSGDDYNLAGFAVGAVERGRMLDGRSVIPGDVILGLVSSGLHANGYSLVRRIIADQQLSYTDQAPFSPGVILSEILLRPTYLYVKPCLALVKAGLAKALAHITGGGLVENIPRVIPDTCSVELDATTWPIPPVFHWLAKVGNVALPEMVRTFNCGIGMIAIIAPANIEYAVHLLSNMDVRSFVIGSIVNCCSGKSAVTISNMDIAWNS